MKRIINVKVCPGEPTDGTGRVCIHLFVKDERGTFVEPHVIHQATDAAGQPIKGQLVAKETRGRLACSPTRKAAPTTTGGVTTVTPRTDDARAVTCPKCIASKDYMEMTTKIAQAEAAR